MKNWFSLWVVSCFVLISSVAFAEERPESRIIGGDDATALEYDFFVSLMLKYKWGGASEGEHWNPVCGASYIGSGHVVTAAHCLDGLRDGVTFGVLPGNRNGELEYEYCTNEGVSPYNCESYATPNESIQNYHFTGFLVYTGTQSDVIEITKSHLNVALHEDYKSSPPKNDIALIRLPGTIPYTAASLTNRSFAQLPAEATVIGHGNTSTAPTTSNNPSQPSALLQKVTLPLVSDSDCKKVYSSLDESTMICAGYEDGQDSQGNEKDSCQGDSGGPLFISSGTTTELVGIVSFGLNCADTYGVYTDLVNYRNWVNQKTTQTEWEDTSDSGSSQRLGSGGSMTVWLIIMSMPLVFLRLKSARTLSGLLLALGLTACSSNPFKPDSSELLFNPVLNEEGLEFSVVSTGCTKKDHFYLRVKGDEIEVRRTQRDMCRMAPHLVRFMMPLPEGESVWRIQNPVRYSNRTSGPGIPGESGTR